MKRSPAAAADNSRRRGHGCQDARAVGHRGVPRHPSAPRSRRKVLILTSFADDEALFSAIMAGASGYVLKQIHGNDLLDAIHRVAKGESLLDPSVTGRVLARIRGDVLAGARGRTLSTQLTPQERRIIGLVAEGMTNRQIGEKRPSRREDGEELREQHPHEARLSRRAEVAAFMARRTARRRLPGLDLAFLRDLCPVDPLANAHGLMPCGTGRYPLSRRG